jgi:hypothetical protein
MILHLGTLLQCRGTDWFLEDTFTAAFNVLKESDVGQQLALEPRRVRLPEHYSSPGATKIGSSGVTWHGNSNSHQVPLMLLKPATNQMKIKYICCMIGELRTMLALDLDTSPTYERGMGLQASNLAAEPSSWPTPSL